MANKIDELVIKLANTKTEETLFNPYNQVCKDYDINTAPGVRQGNLRMYLESYAEGSVEELWVTSSADFHTTKLTGVPLLDPVNFAFVEGILGAPIKFEIATKNRTIFETNKLFGNVWDLAAKQKKRPLIWAVLPFYPHDTAGITTKRVPEVEEYRKYKEFLMMVIGIYKPKNIVTIGPDAKKAVSSLKLKSKAHKSLN
ncbi:hypothetical protein A2415_03325 [candidate division WWE3 bacterium RIFOXYC1_FULL_39_7]|uniref:Uracil-DNA glycosylase-like domain-containing protein n=2 Tax=Katanobacteria TaxID=422282 RepID=A0A1F4X3W7_UNCKA|nr:MAG: hypothetical protein A2415_03325 [candidate division WWE3 bacterium RIFOXYC1_FULL_39_7]OGC76345.1 MAG: hypothetical protein A2619_00085 [candidate division WWE3 bacterium RIFOXYD1_FULL_39_9]